ncbi:hypothetical protein T484DRAFT_1894854, partial [Baffinella frigidus]
MALCDRAAACADSFLPHELADSLWALAVLECPPPPFLLLRFISRALHSIHDFQEDDVANFAWALGACGHAPPRVLHARLQARALALAPTMSPGNIASLLWAQARICSTAAALSPSDLASLLWSCAMLRLRPTPETVTALADKAATDLVLLSPGRVADVAWALAALSLPPPPKLARALVARMTAVAPALSPQAAALSLWAASVLALDTGRDGPASEGAKSALWGTLADRMCAAPPQRVEASAVGLAALSAASLRLNHPRLVAWILAAANAHQRHLLSTDLARLHLLFVSLKLDPKMQARSLPEAPRPPAFRRFAPPEPRLGSRARGRTCRRSRQRRAGGRPPSTPLQ